LMRPMRAAQATKQPSLPVQSLDCFVPPAMEKGDGVGYAMNMRAAEAMVSSAPKPMKILPIREVWSKVELPVLAVAITGAGCGAAAAGGSAEAVTGAGVVFSCSARSTSLS
jgi:hypothetical protein